MNTPNTLEPATLAELKAITDQLRNLDRAAREQRREPMALLNSVQADYDAEQKSIVADHQQARKKLKDAMKELERKQSQAWEEYHQRQQAALQPYQQVINGIQENLKTEERKLTAAAAKIVSGKISLTDAVQLIPEDIRPTLIAVDSPEGNTFFLMQLKLAPSCAFVIKAHEGGSTKWGVVVYTLLSEHHHRLLCFCHNGCMNERTFPWTIAAILKQCKERGITQVFGRKVHHNEDGVSFTDGYGYESTIKKLVEEQTLLYMNHYVSLCE